MMDMARIEPAFLVTKGVRQWEAVTNGMSQQFALMERANELNRQWGQQFSLMEREKVYCAQASYH